MQWDPSFALTQGREPITIRPQHHTITVFNTMSPWAEYGFGSYSDGVVDDVHKIVWSMLGWNPTERWTQDISGMLVEYAQWFIGSGATPNKDGTGWLDSLEGGVQSYADALIGLENQWIGDITEHASAIEATRYYFDTLLFGNDVAGIPYSSSPRGLVPVRARAQNWRLLMHTYRAVSDAYMAGRTVYESQFESQQILNQLAELLPRVGPELALQQVNETIHSGFLAQRLPEPLSYLRSRLSELAAALYSSEIHWKSSVGLYGASGSDRGGMQDTIDVSLSGIPYLSMAVDRLLTLVEANSTAQWTGVRQLIQWTRPCDPPLGTAKYTWYDDLGNVRNQPHLIDHDPLWDQQTDPQDQDPTLFNHSISSSTGNVLTPAWTLPWTWQTYAESLYDAPVTVRYTNLPITDTEALVYEYELRAVPWGDDYHTITTIVLEAANPDGSGQPILIGESAVPAQPTPVVLKYTIPPEAISTSGELVVMWSALPRGRGGSGRGTQIAEMWLMAMSPNANDQDQDGGCPALIPELLPSYSP